jgi:hypothetical protein
VNPAKEENPAAPQHSLIVFSTLVGYVAPETLEPCKNSMHGAEHREIQELVNMVHHFVEG